MASDNVLPIIGNGDLHTTHLVKERMSKTNCPALMLGRGPLRNPFIFLEPYLKDTDDIQFSAADCLEVVERYLELLTEHTPPERTRAILLNMRKQIVWFASGYPGVTKFRGEIFKAKDLDETMKLTRDYFNSLTGVRRAVDETQAFLTGGHG
jgi:tRNA-dihydrouridine synthase